MQTRGFVTLAVGDEKYYQLAANLLYSYKYHSVNPIPFAIICDKKNKYTDLFDKVVILDTPTKSYMDKLTILNIPPFEKNIFIDADCLAYKDLNELWKYMPTEGISCFGKALNLDSEDGWFNINDIGEYKTKINFIPQMHGGVIFFNNDALSHSIYQQALIISKNYLQYKFKYFTKPADEPILALSMAINNCKPIHTQNEAYIFYPTKRYIKSNIKKGELKYSYDGNNWISNILLLHWQNHNTHKAHYQTEIARLQGGDCLVLLLSIKYHFMDLYSKTVLRYWIGIKRYIARYER